ncbi:MAG: glycosyltransferase [Acidobacteriota bacterium]
MTPAASIVICAYNDAEYIERTVRAALAQSLPDKEVIVVDDHSTDRTGAVLDRIPGIKLLRNERNVGLGASLTRGFRAASAPIVFSLHSDCLLVDPEWTLKMLQLFGDPSVGAVVSRRVYPPRASLPLGARLFDVVCPQHLNPRTDAPAEIDFFRGKADAYRRDVIEKLGAWDPAFFTAGEDTDLSIKMRAAGYKILLHPEARVEYIFSSRQKTVSGGLKKALLYGRTAALLYKRHRYDGLQTRCYLWCLMAIPLLALPALARLLLSLLLFASAFNRTFVVHRLCMRVPLAAFHLLFLTLLCAYAFFAGDPPLLVAGLAVPLSSLALPAIISVRNALRALKEGERVALMPPACVYAFAWHLLSGAGYLVGWAALVFRRKG